jgi:TPR repeat protein
MNSFVCGTLPWLLICVVALPAAQRCAEASDVRGETKLAQVRARAEQGHVQEQIELAAAFMTGRGVEKDPAQAARWYLKAAEGGDPEAQNQVGYFYQTGIGVAQDLARATHWFQLSSSAGFVPAKVNLGVSYLQGLGVAKSAPMARDLFLEAEKKGSGRGATYLGVMAYFGIGGPVDRSEAEHWFEAGTKLHDPEAAYDLALLCTGQAGPGRSDSGRSDSGRAVELLRLAAGKGYVPALHSLGLLLVNHAELAQGDGEARAALEAASGAGNWKSSVLLAILWRDGKAGVARDAGRAFYYFQLAGLQGGAEAVRLVAADVAASGRRIPAERMPALTAEATSWFHEHPAALLFVVKDGEQDRNFPLLAVADATLQP